MIFRPRRSSTEHGVRRLALGVLAVIALALTAAAPARAQDATATVTINGGFDRTALTVAPGTTVTWQIADGQKHRIRSTSGPARFDSGGLEGGSFSFVFNDVGTYTYRDEEFKDLAEYSGSVTVEAPATGGGGAPVDPGGGGGGGGGGGTAPPPPPANAAIRIANRAYSPVSISVAVGTTVVWTNADRDNHTVTARSRAFDSGSFGSGGTFRQTFTSPGNVEYFCTIHPNMVGIIAVSVPATGGGDGGGGGGGGGGALPPPPPPPAPPPTAPPPPPARDPDTVQILDYEFRPATLTVPTGTSVTWGNLGLAVHTVSARDGSFGSANLSTGGVYVHTFTTPGTFRYLCDIHPEMVATIAVTGAAGEPPPPAAPEPPTTTVPVPAVPTTGGVQIEDFSFTPSEITIAEGGSVTFVNAGVARHTATARDGTFDSGMLARGGTYRAVFPKAGTFNYFCSLHPQMKGTVLVTGAAGEPPPPPAPEPERPVIPPGRGDVRLVDFAFAPQSITIAAGGSVSFVNAGAAPHTVTARDRGFDSGMIQPGGTYRTPFPNPGTFNVYCTLHPQMTGTILVTGTDGSAPPPAVEAPPPPPPPSAVSVQVLDDRYDPATVSIALGGTVTWTIVSSSAHIITADDGSFDSGLLSNGRTFAQTFTTPGTFGYHDRLTGDMVGSVMVIADGESLDTGATSDGSSASIAVVDFDFDPRQVTVRAGATVSWTNVGQAPHTVVARDGTWGSDVLELGGRFERTFPDPGTFEYYCTLHPNMVATLVVTDETGNAPPPAVAAAAPPAAPGGGAVDDATAGLLDATSDRRVGGGLAVTVLVAVIAVAVAGAVELMRRPDSFGARRAH